MSTTTAQMGLLIPVTGDTDYPASITSSLNSIDTHNHATGNGTQILASGLASNSVTTIKILDANVTKPKLAALGQQLSVTSGTYAHSGAVESLIPGLTVTITTTGRPVFVGLISDGNVVIPQSLTATTLIAESNIQCDIEFHRDGTRINVMTFGMISVVPWAAGTVVATPYSAFTNIEVPAAGTYIYTVKIRTTNAAVQAVIGKVKLLAYEL